MFLEEGTVNLETWNNVGDRLRAQYTADGPEYMAIFTFASWFMNRNCLVPTASDKQRFSFLLSDLTLQDMPSVSEERNGICGARCYCWE
jgi:hypothetical protein